MRLKIIVMYNQLYLYNILGETCWETNIKMFDAYAWKRCYSWGY